MTKMTRWFGILHCYVIDGESVHHSYQQYRRRRSRQSSYRKVTCGLDPCGCDGPDICWGKADPYVAVDIEIGAGRFYRIGRTHTIDNNHNPKWLCEFSGLVDVTDDSTPFPSDFIASRKGPQLLVRCIDDDVGGDTTHDVLGQCTFPLKEVVDRGKPLRVQLTMKHPKANPHAVSTSRVKVEFRWWPITLDPESNAVPKSYFRRSHGNLVRLYQDADLPAGVHEVSTNQPGGFQRHSAWNDIYAAINNAKYFVFLAGWSVNPAISLTRSYKEGEVRETIGELLKRKAESGVQICVMIWDDITSREGVSWLKDGLMATYDEYTREYFKDTRVEVAVCKRIAGDDVGEISDLLKWTSFTHHQKICLYDCPNPLDTVGRRIVGAFIGGLDLTSGRYDTPTHPLFTTLNTAHTGDFYNGCLVEATKDYGPREPWHDIHARIEGPACWDIMQTYLERIEKQAPGLTAATHLLINDLRERRKVRDGRKVLIDPADPRSWDIQVFRSLDTESALFQNRKWTAAFANSSQFVDKGIQTAYLYHISKAKRFIYIENQYFLGSSQWWLEHEEIPCHNWVPYSLVRRICSAIDQGEKFVVYVLIPLFPEGAPGSVSVQEILQWEFQTIRMMYNRIGQKLLQHKMVDAHPLDYLQILFVGKREPESNPPCPSSLPADVQLAIKTRRHPIYVHSKMMIVDDEYIFIGSANINERSMAGCRDTEIAFGACQPSFVATHLGRDQVKLPLGDIGAFRLRLWEEHLGPSVTNDSTFDDPGSTRCARRIFEMTRQNWAAYIDEQPDVQMPYGHMCPFPVQVLPDGTTTAIPEHPNIPGWNCSVVGARSTLLPSALTT